MPWTLSGTTVTQTGTDTTWDGLNGIAGVTRLDTGDGHLYYCPTLRLNISGNLTIADPSKDYPIAFAVRVQGTGVYTSGEFASDGVTPKTTGTHFVSAGLSSKGPDVITNSAFGVATGGQATLIGGNYALNGGVFYANGAVIRDYGVDKFTSTDFAAGSARIRSYSSDVIMRKCRHYDLAMDMFRMPIEFSVQAIAAEWLTTYVGSSFGGGTDAKFTAYTPDNVDGQVTIDNYGGGWIELYNSGKGADLLVSISNPSATFRDRHAVPLFQEINFSVTNLAGASLQNTRFKCTDSPINSPTATITTTGSLKTWDFRDPLSYTGTTNASGVAASAPILQVWWGTLNTKNLRFPLSTATYQFRTFDYQTQSTSIVLGSDNAIAKGMALVPLTTAVTVSEATASALTGITFTPSGATGGSIVISANRTLQDLWNYYRAWISQFTNWDSTDTWTCSGGLLNLGTWSLTVNAGAALTKTAAISSLTTSTTITINGTTDATFTDSTGTRVTIRERTDKLLSTYVTINGTPVGGTVVDGTLRSGWVPLSAARVITVQPADAIRIAASFYGSKPTVFNMLGSEIDKFTLSLDLEPAIDTNTNVAIRDEITACFSTVTNGATLEVTINKTLKAYTPKQVLAGLDYYIVSRGDLLHSVIAQNNNASLYSMSEGTIVTYSPAYKIRMSDLDALGNPIVPTTIGYEVPLVIYYEDLATGIKSTMTLLNASGAFLGTAPWTQQQASIGDADKQAIADTAAVEVWTSTTRTLTSSAGGATLAEIEASTVLAKETTLAAKASQTSVNAIPTNPLLTSDTRLDNLDAAVSSRLATSGYTAPDNTSITAIKAKTDTLVNAPTLAQIEASTVLAKETTLASKASQTSVNAIPTNPLLTSDTRLNNLDAAVSSRLATSGYTAPDNTAITAIKAKTDTLVNAPTLAEIESSTVLAKEGSVKTVIALTA